MRKILSILFLSLFSVNSSWSGVPCIGWESDSGNSVLGDCTNDIFLGYVSKTNVSVMGTCFDGMIMAFNHSTDDSIWGDCSAEYRETYKELGLKQFKWEKYYLYYW